MSEAFFSVNDLSRRKLQTGLVVFGMALCVASTLFLLLLGDKIGFGILSVAENRLTTSFSRVFSNFIAFTGFLVFAVGVVIIAFLVFVMMSQRVRDIGLMKATGCPNDLIFGYFMNELVIVTFLGCFLGTVLGILADYASTSLLSNLGFQVPQGSINFWLALLLFTVFFVLSLVVGAKPILDTTKVEPARAMSPSYHLGLTRESDFRGSARAGFTFRIAMRNLFRRKSATLRIVISLIVVFILVTVAMAGGMIADQTTRSWIEKAAGKDVVLIAHHDVCSRYMLLMSKFYEVKEVSSFSYTESRYLLPDGFLNQLASVPNVKMEPRLILEDRIKEVEGWIIDPTTAVTKPIGDSRECTSLIVGVEPRKVFSDWVANGRLLGDEWAHEGVVGDSLAGKLFSSPLYQNMTLFGVSFDVVGVCLDPINNGNVTYVPLKTLQHITNMTKPNAVMVQIASSADRSAVLDQIRTEAAAWNSEFEAFELNEELNKEVGFVGYIWSTIMLSPLFTLSAASLCLIGYVVLTINEQKQEFGILRAIGAKPRTIVKIISLQSFLILIASYATGLSLGIILTLLILIPEPLVTSLTVIQIAAWLLVALGATFVFSLYPALKFAKKPILETIGGA